jgi:hypothetical protein
MSPGSLPAAQPVQAVAPVALAQQDRRQQASPTLWAQVAAADTHPTVPIAARVVPVAILAAVAADLAARATATIARLAALAQVA